MEVYGVGEEEEEEEEEDLFCRVKWLIHTEEGKYGLRKRLPEMAYIHTHFNIMCGLRNSYTPCHTIHCVCWGEGGG